MNFSIMTASLGVTTQVILTALVGFAVAGCAETTISPRYDNGMRGLQLPERILVYDFAVTTAEVKENAGFLQGTMNDIRDVTPSENEQEIAREVQNVAAEEFVERLRRLGLPAERVARNTPMPPQSFAITGQFLDVNEGNKTARLVIGFGKGQARVDIQIQTYESGLGPVKTAQSRPTLLLEFLTNADSGSMPGAIVTAGAGAAAEAGAGAIVGANVGIGGIKSYRSSMGAMTARSVEKAMDYLSGYFWQQAWISSR